MIDYKVRYELLKKYTFFKQQADALAVELNKLEEEERKSSQEKQEKEESK